MKVSTENDNNFGYEKNYDCGRQYPFKWKYLIQKFHDICLSYYFNPPLPLSRISDNFATVPWTSR